MQNDFSGSTGARVRLWRSMILDREPNWRKKESIQIQQHSAAFESVFKFLSPKTKPKLKAAANLFVHITLKTSVL